MNVSSILTVAYIGDSLLRVEKNTERKEKIRN